VSFCDPGDCREAGTCGITRQGGDASCIVIACAVWLTFHAVSEKLITESCALLASAPEGVSLLEIFDFVALQFQIFAVLLLFCGSRRECCV
jgi:hypothetical protein